MQFISDLWITIKDYIKDKSLKGCIIFNILHIIYPIHFKHSLSKNYFLKKFWGDIIYVCIEPCCLGLKSGKVLSFESTVYS